MSVPLYAYDQSFEGHISTHVALKWERAGVAVLVREKRGRNKGTIRRAVMRRRNGDPRATQLRDHLGHAYSYRHELDDGHRLWALRPLGDRIKADPSPDYNLAPPEARVIFLRVLLDCLR
jgi:hypothetical protein